MARTWFAGSATAPWDPPSRAALPNTSHDLAPSNQSMSSKNQIAVHDSSIAHAITPTTKATHSDSLSDGPVTWTEPSTSPQKEPIAQLAKESFDTSADSTKLIERLSKPEEPQTAGNIKSRDPRLSKPAATMDALAPSPSVPRQAPIAQMVPRPSNAAVATTSATIPNASTTSLFGSGPSTVGALEAQAFFPAAGSTSLSLSSSPVLPSQPTATPRKRPEQTSTPKTTPRITVTPAPATASSAFKDAALASHVQNTRFLSPPTKQQTNGIKKRPYIRKNQSPLTSSLTADSVPGEKSEQTNGIRKRQDIKKNQSPLTASPTADSVPGEKRGRGRPRITQTKEQPSGQQQRQHRPPVELRTPLPSVVVPTQSISPLSNVSTLPTQPQQTLTPPSKPPSTPTSKTPSTPTLCSEEPRLWPGRDDYVASLLHFDARPETIHSTPIRACANSAAHRPMDPQQPSQGHGVCTACRHCAFRHIRASRADQLGSSAWWPLCKTCGNREILRIEPGKRGCNCFSEWLCFSCLTEVVERRAAMNEAEAETRRRTLVKEGMDGEDRTVTTGWACECGMEIRPEPTLMKCVGCHGMRVGKVDPRETAAREDKLREKALAWT